MEKKEKVEYRYYEMPEKEWILPLLGEDWIRNYGLDYTHFHNYLEIGVCHYGIGEVIIEDKRYSFNGGQVTIIPPNVPHDTRTIGETNYWEWMYIDVAAILEDMYPNDKLSAEEIKQEVHGGSFFIEQSQYPALMNILYAVMKESKEKQYMYRESIKGYLRSFIVELLRMNQCKKDCKKINQNTLLISAAVTYVEQHYKEDMIRASKGLNSFTV